MGTENTADLQQPPGLFYSSQRLFLLAFLPLCQMLNFQRSNYLLGYQPSSVITRSAARGSVSVLFMLPVSLFFTAILVVCSDRAYVMVCTPMDGLHLLVALFQLSVNKPV